MSGMINWWARNSIAANLLMVAIFIGGIVTFIGLDREVFPSPKINSVSVSVVWQGASPIEVEEQIILRIEEAVSGIDNLDQITAVAREGVARVTVSMVEQGNFTEFLNEVKSQVDGISTLPRDAFPPVVSRFSSNNQIFSISLAGDVEERELYRLARQYRDELASLPNGSPLVTINGARDEEVSIEVSEEALRRYGLTFDDVARAIRGTSIDGSSGTVRTETGSINLSVRNLADTEEEFSRIIVRQNPDGSFITVGDVANVVDGFVDAKFKTELDGNRSISLNVNAPENFNVVELSKAINAWVDEKQETQPEELDLEIQFDFSEAYTERMELVSSNALTGLILVMIVLVLFLRPIVAFWVVIGIATAFAGSFIFLPMVGITLNMLSLFGLLLVIGIVVDDALIVGESIHRQTERGKQGIDAALIGTQIVVKPVFFAVLTTMIAFLPFILIGGPASEQMANITYVVIFALTFSLIESFLILPAHLSHMKPVSDTNAFNRFQQKIADSMIWFSNAFYRPLISMSIRFRWATIITFFGFFMVAISLLSQGWVRSAFIPDVEAPFINVNVTPREGTPYARNLEVYDILEAAAEELKAEVRAEEDGNELIESIFVFASEGGSGAFLTLNDGDWRTISAREIADRLREKIGDIPDAESIDIGFTLSDGGSDLNFGIESNDLDELRRASADIVAYLNGINGVYDIRNQLQSVTDEIQVTLKPGAERFGLSLAEVSRQVRQAYFGEEAQRLPREGEDVRVMVRYPKETRENLESLQSFRIRTPDGREIPLSAIVDINYAPSYSQIRRFERKRSTTVTADVQDGIDANAIRQDFYRTYFPEFKDRYPNVSIAQRGQTQDQQEFFAELVTLLMLAIIAMYMLVAIGFSSYFQPILIMSAIPFAVMGAIFGHLFWGEPFGVFSVFGVCAAAGVVVNDNLVLVDYVNRLRREGAGAFSALVEAGVARFRPIILTSLTTFLGLVPIMLETSINADFLRPMIVALAYGVLFALFVTLIFVPALYAVGTDIARFFRGVWTGEPQPKLGQGQSLDGVVPDVDSLLQENEEKDLEPEHR